VQAVLGLDDLLSKLFQFHGDSGLVWL
jgi:hypothetical protein